MDRLASVIGEAGPPQTATGGKAPSLVARPAAAAGLALTVWPHGKRRREDGRRR